MNPDTQGRQTKSTLKKNINFTTPHGTNNLSYKKSQKYNNNNNSLINK
jgi:hypothetical protein